MSKYQEALDRLCMWATNKYCALQVPNAEYKDLKALLQELVDKATPEKPRKETFITGKSAYLCPTCQYALSSGKEYVSPTLRYCECCGQALDWSEENEE